MGFPDGYPGLCARCGTGRVLSGTYESAFCAVCDEWQTPLCAQAWCSWCSERPARPSAAAELDVAPQGVDPAYDLHLSDGPEVMRRLVMPAVLGTLPHDAVRDVRLSRSAGGAGDAHWPKDVPTPDHVDAVVTLTEGEQEHCYLGQLGWICPTDVIDDLVSTLEDFWCESGQGWGQLLRGSARALPAGPG